MKYFVFLIFCTCTVVALSSWRVPLTLSLVGNVFLFLCDGLFSSGAPAVGTAQEHANSDRNATRTTPSTPFSPDHVFNSLLTRTTPSTAFSPEPRLLQPPHPNQAFYSLLTRATPSTVFKNRRKIIISSIYKNCYENKLNNLGKMPALLVATLEVMNLATLVNN